MAKNGWTRAPAWLAKKNGVELMNSGKKMKGENWKTKLCMNIFSTTPTGKRKDRMT